MRRILYLECYSGISGDMTVGALLDLGADKKAVDEAIDSIKPLVSGFDVVVTRVQKAGIDACDFNVILDREHENHDHDMAYLHGHEHHHEDEGHVYGHHDGEGHVHGHHDGEGHVHGHHDGEGHVHGDEEHVHGHHDGEGHCHADDGQCYDDGGYMHGEGRCHVGEEHVHGEGHHHEGDEHNHAHGHHAHIGLAEITDVLQKAKLTDSARALALKIFGILAEAESKAHNRPVNEVHFHEVGAVDSIVDIMSAAVCIDSLKEKYNITDVIVSELYEGQGSVRCQHGILPVPVPATANIMETYGLPVHFMGLQGEFVTPTGAAIAAAVRTAGQLPDRFRVVSGGIGAGKRNYEKASLLRAMVVEELAEQRDVIYKLESNIDDCPGEAFGYVMDRLLDAGARDVYYTPIYMKKNRPAYQLNVICKEPDIPKLEQIIFCETTTIGIRRVEMERTVLRREQRTEHTSLGTIGVKVCGDRVYPEYEALTAVCQQQGLSYLEAYNRVFAELNR